MSEKITGRRCFQCQEPAVRMCDFPAEHAFGSDLIDRNKCSLLMCIKHAKQGVTNGYDFCNLHFDKAFTAYSRRTPKRSST